MREEPKSNDDDLAFPSGRIGVQESLYILQERYTVVFVAARH